MSGCFGGQPAPNNPNSNGSSGGMCFEASLQSDRTRGLALNNTIKNLVKNNCSVIPSAQAAMIHTDGWCCPILPLPNNNDPCCLPTAESFQTGQAFDGGTGMPIYRPECHPGTAEYQACHNTPVSWENIGAVATGVQVSSGSIKDESSVLKPKDAAQLGGETEVKPALIDTDTINERVRDETPEEILIEDESNFSEGTIKQEANGDKK
jgi:hypothetical protein